MVKISRYLSIVILICAGLAFSTADAQENLAQQVSAIFQQSCLICHGPHGSFTEQLVIQSSQELINTGKVIPGNPDDSIFYQRLIETAVERRMPLGQPPLAPEAIETIRQWIQAGAPDWNAFARTDIDFITTEEILETIENHVNSLAPFDRTFARYFTSTHLYNAGEDLETLNAYRRALSKLVNSLSWGREVIRPQPIDTEETIFYIDLRDYEWEIGTNRWTLIETEYPYTVAFDAPTQTVLREKLTNLREEMSCEVPFVHVDWFLATASLPPLYHDILDLPLTDSELEARLEVNVVENIRNAPGRRVWRAGFNDSGVSNHNRVVERHLSRYGAYWKSYDFAASVGTQNIFTHPLSFTHDGGEIIFNLPNGLQAYYLADAGGSRLDEAPINIVSNPAASDPTVRNGLSCIGCHTEGMKTFEDRVRGVVEQNKNPPFDKDRVLRLYVEKTVMDALIEEDTDRYRQALEETGDVFGGIEPVQRFHEAFQGPVDAAYAAAAVGLETEVFLGRIRENASLQNLGLLVLENGSVKRDAWTSNFDDVISALNSPDSGLPSVVQRPERIPGASVDVPDPNLRAAIAEALEKEDTDTVPITPEDMTTLTTLRASNRGIKDLTGIEHAINLEELWISKNPISDLSPLAELKNLIGLGAWETPISDLSPLAGLKNLRWLDFGRTPTDGNRNLIGNLDLTPLSGITSLRKLTFYACGIKEIAALAGLTGLTHLQLGGNRDISDASPVAGLINLEHLDFHHDSISDLSPLEGLTKLKSLNLYDNRLISDLSPLASLIELTELRLARNIISDVSPLAGLINLERLILSANLISDISPLKGLINLKGLNLSNNLISDISSLDGLAAHTYIVWLKNPGAPIEGPKIEGPWLWMLISGKQLDSDTDWLAEVSDGSVTEHQIATKGATEGKTVGDNKWTAHNISPIGRNNFKEVLKTFGVPPDQDTSHNVIYGCTILTSPRQQHTKMLVGTEGHHKIWLNGKLIHHNLNHPKYFTNDDRSNHDYAEFFSVTLKEGANIVLVAVDDAHWITGHFGFEEGTEYTVLPPGVGFTFSTMGTDLLAGDTFTLNLNAENITDLAGWQAEITFDPTILEATEVTEGDFLKAEGGDTFFQNGTIDNTTGKITDLFSARISESGVSGTGTLLSVTLKAKAGGETQVTLENFEFSSISGEVISAVPPNITITIGEYPAWDVNQDGRVSVADLVLVAQHLGENASASPQADVNRDGVINIQDLIIVAQHLGESTDAASPSVITAINNGELTPAMIQTWIQQAQLENDGSLAFRQGIATLERLLALFIPEETALLHNYPNPFNPETWIPYQLAKPTEVTLTIYATNGAIVRTLELGHQPAGFYESRSRAAYWDGRNEVGEPVASGIYFYSLTTGTTGDFNATKKMLIMK